MKTNTRQLVTDAMLAAMCAVLGYLSLDMQSLKITFEGFPVLLGALLFGPVDGLAIGAVGTAVYQLLRYGVSATTILWILPYALSGLLVGWVSKRHSFELNRREVLVLVFLSEVMVTALNTGSIYIDSKLYGYYSPVIITGMLIPRIAICIGKGIAFGLLLPYITRPVQKTLQNEGLRKRR